MTKQEYTKTMWWKEHVKFVQEIKDGKIPFFQNDGKPLESWRLFETRSAARDAAWDAAWDAVLYTLVFHVCSGLDISEKHKSHVKNRWKVWQKGYGLLCDVNKVLYVYKKVE